MIQQQRDIPLQSSMCYRVKQVSRLLRNIQQRDSCPFLVASNVKTAAPKSSPDITIKANQIPEALPPPVEPDCDTPVKNE
jgi:hypothetical protein